MRKQRACQRGVKSHRLRGAGVHVRRRSAAASLPVALLLLLLLLLLPAAAAAAAAVVCGQPLLLELLL